MNFIIEVIKKSSDGPDCVFVVRRGDGFPLHVGDSLDDAKDFLQEQISQALKPKSDA